MKTSQTAIKFGGFLAVAFTLILGVSGCQAIAKPEVMNPTQAVTLPLTDAKLQNYVWQLASITDKAGEPIDSVQKTLANQLPLQVKFEKGGKVSFNNTCNKMWGNYMLTNDNVVVGDIASTRMMCEPAKMAVDSLAGEVLKGQFKLTETSGGQPILTITSDNQIRIFRPVAR